MTRTRVSEHQYQQKIMNQVCVFEPLLEHVCVCLSMSMTSCCEPSSLSPQPNPSICIWTCNLPQCWGLDCSLPLQTQWVMFIRSEWLHRSVWGQRIDDQKHFNTHPCRWLCFSWSTHSRHLSFVGTLITLICISVGFIMLQFEKMLLFCLPWSHFISDGFVV